MGRVPFFFFITVLEEQCATKVYFFIYISKKFSDYKKYRKDLRYFKKYITNLISKEHIFYTKPISAKKLEVFFKMPCRKHSLLSSAYPKINGYLAVLKNYCTPL
jgi:hypothetical protein